MIDVVDIVDVVVDHNPDRLPDKSKSVIPVQLYDVMKRDPRVSVIGRPVLDLVKRLGVSISPIAFDLLTLSLAITAADTFVSRKDVYGGWIRNIRLRVPLLESAKWQTHVDILTRALNFLSGDVWHIEIRSGDLPPPQPYPAKNNRKMTPLENLDCVCLFSGGLDSTTGAIDLLSQRHSPLLVSHAYTGDQGHQKKVARQLNGNFSHFAVNASPKSVSKNTDIMMRTRSFNFLALGAVGANAIAQKNQLDQVTLFIPENGFISLNVPLTPRRIGAFSTRTTHPYFIELMQSLFKVIGLNTTISNPYCFKTKGEMFQQCYNPDLLKAVIGDTVSCSKWKRKHKACGRCVPCLIRRSALHKAGIAERVEYLTLNLHQVIAEPKIRDDLFAMIGAIIRLPQSNIGSWISENGPISLDKTIREQYKSVFVRGLNEVETFLRSEKVL